jgi:signal-transduction protein with cAMP-binding, CBS, and nucleotidyltransferase domain
MPRRIRQIMLSDEVATLPPSASVYAAAAVMKRQRQCVVLVMTEERLEGILTEQDVVRRVVAEQRDPSMVTLGNVMTINPDTIAAGDLALTGLQMMEDGCYRHLPVVENGRVIGLISRVDFLGEEKTELETERHCWERLGQCWGTRFPMLGQNA